MTHRPPSPPRQCELHAQRVDNVKKLPSLGGKGLPGKPSLKDILPSALDFDETLKRSALLYFAPAHSLRRTLRHVRRARTAH